MSQIDKLNYVPLLFWFLIFFGFLYFYLVLYILPFIFGSLRTRALFFNYLVNEILYWALFKYCVNFLYGSSAHHTNISCVLAFVGAGVYLDFFFYRGLGFMSACANVGESL